MDYADYDIAANETSDIETAPFPVARPTTPGRRGSRQAAIAVVEEGTQITQQIWAICDFLNIALVRVSSRCDLSRVLCQEDPMAVVCELDSPHQDGCHVMKTVAGYDPSLPILLLTGDAPALVGAADAVEEIWKLTEVMKVRALPGMAGLVDFLFRSGRKGNCLRLMPARS